MLTWRTALIASSVDTNRAYWRNSSGKNAVNSPRMSCNRARPGPTSWLFDCVSCLYTYDVADAPPSRPIANALRMRISPLPRRCRPCFLATPVFARAALANAAARRQPSACQRSPRRFARAPSAPSSSRRKVSARATPAAPTLPRRTDEPLPRNDRFLVSRSCAEFYERAREQRRARRAFAKQARASARYRPRVTVPAIVPLQGTNWSTEICKSQLPFPVTGLSSRGRSVTSKTP